MERHPGCALQVLATFASGRPHGPTCAGRNSIDRPRIPRLAESGARRSRTMPEGERFAVRAAVRGVGIGRTSVAGTSLRPEVDAFRKRFQDLRTQDKVHPECEALVRGLRMRIQRLLAVLMEKTTRTTSRNSGLPPSQTDQDESARRTGSPGKGPKPNPQTGGHRRTTPVQETITVDACGADLDDVDPVDRERRVLYDLGFEVVERRIDAEIQEGPKCRARTQGRFPDPMPGPVQYGVRIPALVLNLRIAQMRSLRRAVSLVHALSGIQLSEATGLGQVRRFQDALAS